MFWNNIDKDEILYKLKRLPIVTIILFLLNSIVGIITIKNGLNETLHNCGMYGGALANGEWLRVIFHAFVHLDLNHYFANMTCLLGFGIMLERNIGWWKLLIIYVCGIIGSALSINFFAANGIHAGASGAIWALMFAAVVYNIRYRENIRGSIFCIIINLAYSFSAAEVSLEGHLGGGVAGIIAAIFLCRRQYEGSSD